MDKNNLTYQRSGVNIKEADKFVRYISHIAKKTKQNNSNKLAKLKSTQTNSTTKFKRMN